MINQLPRAEHNAILHLFSTKPELLAYGVQHYQIRSAETSSLLLELFQRLQKEMHTMPDALEEFTREAIERFLKELPIKNRLEGLSPEQRLEGLSPEGRQALLRLLQGQGPSSKPT